MNWIKLHQDYPLAMQYMADEFMCLYTIKVYDARSSQKLGHKITYNIKHCLKRDLYDFFDGEGIEVDTRVYRFDISWKNEGCMDFYGSNIDIESRPQAETEAFTKAFEILNKRLDESAKENA